MNTSEYHLPTVPNQLLPDMAQDQFLEAHERWQSLSLDDVSERYMPDPTATEFGSATVLRPSKDLDDGSYAVISLAHGQEMKPPMAIRLGFLQDAVMPNKTVVVMTNDGYHGKSNVLSRDTMAEITAGNMLPFYEQKARILDEIGVEGEVVLGGWSLGALTTLGLAQVASEQWQAAALSVDEPPNVRRTSSQLGSDFLKSGGWSLQRAAMAESAIPVLMEAYTKRRMALDYAKFGIATQFPANKALQAGMATHDFNKLVEEAAAAQPEAFIKMSQVIGSLITSYDSLEAAAQGVEDGSRLAIVQYDGPGSRRHSTVDNISAHALTIAHTMRLAGLDQPA